MSVLSKDALSSTRFIALLGGICLLALLIMSYIYYQERIYFSDPAFQLFLLINDQSIEVMTNRWPSVIFRILPFIGMKMGMGVGVLAKLFSVSFPLYQAGCFAIILFILKDRVLALLALCCLLIGTTESFYWCSSDLLQGLMTAFLAIAIYKKKEWTWNVRAAMSLPFLLCTVFFHPLTLFPFFYVLIDDVLEHRRLHWQDAFMGVAFGAVWLIRNIFFATWYDNAKSAEFWGNFEKYELLQIPTHGSFLLHEVPLFYQLVFLMGCVSLVILIRNKFFFRALFLIASCLVVILIVHIGNPNPSQHFYREASYVPLVVFVSYPFVKHVLRFDQIELKYKIFTALVLLLSIARILFFAPEYTARIDTLQEQIDNTSCQKTIWKIPEVKQSVFKMDWGIPFETLLLSTEQGAPKTIFNTGKPKDYLKKERKDVFLGPFKILYTSDFNTEYFNFDKTDYCAMRVEQLKKE